MVVCSARGAAKCTCFGNDEMSEAAGDEWADLEGQICFERGHEAEFIATPYFINGLLTALAAPTTGLAAYTTCSSLTNCRFSR